MTGKLILIVISYNRTDSGGRHEGPNVPAIIRSCDEQKNNEFGSMTCNVSTTDTIIARRFVNGFKNPTLPMKELWRSEGDPIDELLTLNAQ